ncbi:MAG: exodeoxyribonuclease III [Pseudomonadales bacterium]
MRVISFCADGIKQAAKNGFYDWATNQDADIICVQDLAAQEYDLQDNLYHPDGYYGYFLDSPEPNTNGVAIYVREMPKAIMTGLGLGEADMEARYIQADFERISICCLFAPKATADDADSIAHRRHFFDAYQNHLNKIRNKRRDYIICGSLFTAHREIDLQNPEAAAKQPGFTEDDNLWMDTLYRDLGYVDAFRQVRDDSDEFTWWPDGDRSQNGWRSDIQVVSEGLRNQVEYGTIYKNQVFSSHAPLVMDYDIEI